MATRARVWAEMSSKRCALHALRSFVPGIVLAAVLSVAATGQELLPAPADMKVAPSDETPVLLPPPIRVLGESPERQTGYDRRVQRSFQAPAEPLNPFSGPGAALGIRHDHGLHRPG